MKRSSPRNKLNRKVFETNRALEYLSEKELTAQIGHDQDQWPLAILRELIDNSLDACESAGVSPEIEVTVEDNFIIVTDNGPGIPDQVIERSLDFMVRVSDKAYYVSPTRGQMGNAMKVVYAAPFVQSGGGFVEIAANGSLHHIEITVDHILQQPKIVHTVETHFIKNGTFIKIYFPDSTSSLTKSNEGIYIRYKYPSAESLVDRYRAFNPHASFSFNGKKYPGNNNDWKKWLPNMPTSPHWYNEETLRDLIAGYVAQELRNGHRKKTVREFVSEFKGLTGIAKQKKVTESHARAYLQDFIKDEKIDQEFISDLLTTMQTESKGVKPQALGIIGKDHISQWMTDNGCVRDSIRYTKKQGYDQGMPYVLEIAFGIKEDDNEQRSIVTGLNWSPTIGNDTDPTIRNAIQSSRIDAEDPVILLIHITKPRFKFMDRGKTRLEL